MIEKIPLDIMQYATDEPKENFWLDPTYRGGVEKRIGWWGLFGYWYVVCFRDGTRTKPRWGTNNAERRQESA